MSSSIKTVLLQVFVFSLKFEINDMTRIFAKVKKVAEVKGLSRSVDWTLFTKLQI